MNPPNQYEQALERARDDLDLRELCNILLDLSVVSHLHVDGEGDGGIRRLHLYPFGFGVRSPGAADGHLDELPRRHRAVLKGVASPEVQKLLHDVLHPLDFTPDVVERIFHPIGEGLVAKGPLRGAVDAMTPYLERLRAHAESLWQWLQTLPAQIEGLWQMLFTAVT